MAWPRCFSRVWGGLGNASRVWVGDRHHFFLGFGCPREFWSSERAGGCSRGISYHGREGVYISTVHHVEVIWEGVIYIDNDDIHTWENNVIWEGVYRPSPHVLKLSGGGYIDNDNERTWENNIIGEGVYRPPLVLKLSGEGYIDDDRPDKT